MIGVLIPVHNEEQLLDACLESVLAAASHPRLEGEAVSVLVVLDSCTDRSAEIARFYGVQTLEVTVRNVGAARRAGAGHLLGLGVRWLACTDGDSHVAPDWLAEQLALDADAVCGTVIPGVWHQSIPDTAQTEYHRRYQHRDGHRHSHGANLGSAPGLTARPAAFHPCPAMKTCTWCANWNDAAPA